MTNHTQLKFSLLTEPWINCVKVDGSPTTVGLIELFAQGNQIAGLRGDSPVQDYAVLRTLLAIFWRAHQQPRSSGKRRFSMPSWYQQQTAAIAADEPDTQVIEYLNNHADRFNLFDPVRPFMQVADLHTASGSISPVRRILPDSESTLFSMRAGDDLETLSFAEAARWLITVHAYDYSGIKSGAVGDPRVKGGRGYPIGTGWTGMTGGTFLIGENLRHTLVLNTTESTIRPGDAQSADLPVWERGVDSAEERQGGVITIGGPADLATWQARRVRLHTDGDLITGVLVSNGDKIPDAGLNVFADPMTPYRYSANKSKASFDAYYPMPYSAERTVWKSIEPLLALESDTPFLRGAGTKGKKFKAPQRPAILEQLASYWDSGTVTRSIIPISMVSVTYGNQQSGIDTTSVATLQVPPAALSESNAPMRRAIIDATNSALNAAVELGRFAGNLLVAAGGDYEFQTPVTDAALASLEPDFESWLRTLAASDSDLLERSESWQLHVRGHILSEAQALIRSAGPQALVGRPDPHSLEDPPRIVTAATYLARLRHKLSEILPLTVPRHTDSAPSSSLKEDSHE